MRYVGIGSVHIEILVMYIVTAYDLEISYTHLDTRKFIQFIGDTCFITSISFECVQRSTHC